MRWIADFSAILITPSCPADRKSLQRVQPTGGLEQGRGYGQGLLFARELALRARARLLAQRQFQVAEHKAALGSVDGRAAHPNNGAISSSLAPVSAASKICARLTLRTACLPPFKSP